MGRIESGASEERSSGAPFHVREKGLSGRECALRRRSAEFFVRREQGKERAAVRREVTGWELKWTAVVTMAIDHSAAILMEPAFAQAEPGMMFRVLYLMFRGIGRLAFPLFIFLLTEGFHYTHSRERYLLRLGIFALISYIPFGMAFDLSNREIAAGHFLSAEYQNVFFTLFLGFCAMYLSDRILTWYRDGRCGRAGMIALHAVVFAGCAAVAELINCDYGAFGVAAIEAAYLAGIFRGAVTEGAVITVILGFLDPSEYISFADLLLLRGYRGRQGKKGNKWFFYVFYPAHLLALVGIRFLLYGV